MKKNITVPLLSLFLVSGLLATDKKTHLFNHMKTELSRHNMDNVALQNMPTTASALFRTIEKVVICKNNREEIKKEVTRVLSQTSLPEAEKTIENIVNIVEEYSSGTASGVGNKLDDPNLSVYTKNVNVKDKKKLKNIVSGRGDTPILVLNNPKNATKKSIWRKICCCFPCFWRSK